MVCIWMVDIQEFVRRTVLNRNHKDARTGTRIFSLGCGCIFIPMLLFGILCIVFGLKDGDIVREVATWPSTTGTIIASSYEMSGSGEETRYTIKVQYTFEVDGKELQGNKLFPGRSQRAYAHRREVDKALGRYPEGQKVTVYYDPEQPSRAGLLREPEISTLFGVGLGAFFGFIGLCGTLIALWLWVSAPKARYVEQDPENP